MKNTPLVLSIIALVAVAALGIISLTGNADKKSKSAAVPGSEEVTAQKGAVVYFSLDRILSEYDMANELRSAVESKVQGIPQEVNRRGNKLQSDMNSFQEKINKGLITRSTAEVQGQKLQQQQADFQNYAARKDQEIAEEQQVMLNQIGDAIKKFLDKYNETMQYAMIIATQGDVLPSPVVCGDPSLDITDAVLAGLNDEYVKAKAAGTAPKAETAATPAK